LVLRQIVDYVKELRLGVKTDTNMATVRNVFLMSEKFDVYTICV
jgi:hypothetical protein